MTKQELIEENNRLKAELKKIYGYTSLKPLDGDRIEEECAEKDDYKTIYVRHLAYIAVTAEFALVPDYFSHTIEERKAIIESIQTP